MPIPVHRLLVLVFSLLVIGWAGPPVLRSQDSSSASTTRLAIVGGVTATTVIGVHLYQQAAWWQGRRELFRFQNDWEYALDFDKMGHVYGTYLLSNLFTGGLRWSGVERRPAVFYGSLFGLAYQFYIETEDGFHRDYGFSPGDAASDIIGAAIPIAQETFPVLRNFRMKWSYFPSKKYIEELKQHQARVFIDDYQGQTIWLGVDPHFFLDERTSAAVPSWLGFAIGTAVRDLNGSGAGKRFYYLSLDYNLSRIRTDSEILQTVFSALDFLHFPAPGISYDGKTFRFGIYL